MFKFFDVRVNSYHQYNYYDYQNEIIHHMLINHLTILYALTICCNTLGYVLL